mgnify:CR=1 FL=1
MSKVNGEKLCIWGQVKFFFWGGDFEYEVKPSLGKKKTMYLQVKSCWVDNICVLGQVKLADEYNLGTNACLGRWQNICAFGTSQVERTDY